ncbi:MAG TPA: hypothetical protein VFK79_11825 [Xanthobacteraceae bacterium]|nr:hypothetical protein [Xanthobacteraceae bacterium]
MAGCQSGSSADNTTTFLLSSASCQASAPTPRSLAIGAGAAASGAADSIAIGDFSKATGHRGVAIGTFASARGKKSTAVGPDAGPNSVDVEGATAIGAGAGFRGAGIYSTAIGGSKGGDFGDDPRSDTHAFGGFSIAIGGGESSALPGAVANGYRSIAIGQKSVSADFGTSVGFNTNTAFASTAIGTDAQAIAHSSTALGRFAKASNTSSLALGHGAVASTARSVALGSGSVANVAYTVSVGTPTARRRIVNVAPATSNSDAATLGQVKQIATAAAETAMLSVNVGSNAEIRQELAELRATIRRQQEMLARQQQELVELKGKTAAALVE